MCPPPSFSSVLLCVQGKWPPPGTPDGAPIVVGADTSPRQALTA